jgi:signal transduction histidine kinase
MRLIFKVTFYYLLITLFVFGAGGIMTYNIFQKEVQQETDRYLIGRLGGIETSIQNGESPTAFVANNLSIEEIDNSVPETKFFFRDTLADHPSPRIDRLEPQRKLSVIRKIDGRTFKIEIFDVIVESDDIFSGVFQSQTRLFIILGSVLVLASFFVSVWLFRPFNATLESIKGFRIHNRDPIRLGKTHTKEFRELNQIIDQMTRKIQSDYRNLKEFSENASHEMQTPLSVAKGKLELLLQSKGMDEEQLKLINSAYSAIDHMSKMGRSLGLLTKIENNEFDNLQEVNLSEEIEKTLYDFQELLELKEIDIDSQIERDIVVKTDPILLKVLVGNLFQNAVRHNKPGGKIQVRLSGSNLLIANSGEKLSSPFETMFERFKKDKQSSGTIGLGLAIVKKICDINGFQIHYTYEDDLHCLDIKFR